MRNGKIVSSGWRLRSEGQVVGDSGDKTGGLGRVCGHGEEFVFLLRELDAVDGCRQRKGRM